jgi:hypothetical protein
MWRILLAVFAATSLAACGDESDGGDGEPLPPSEHDGCKLLTRGDATALFEVTAEPDPDSLIVTDPNYFAGCSWYYETPDQLSNQVVFLNIWHGEDYYAPHPDAEPLEIGDVGSIYTSKATGVEVAWTLRGYAFDLNYFAIGAGVPDHTTKVAEVEALAIEVRNRF